jgi:hypothetical protein
MGDSFELTLDHFLIEGAELQLPDFVMVPFERQDRRSPSAAGEAPAHIYEVAVETAATRLDILGFSLPAARRAFERGRHRLREPERSGWPAALLGPRGFDEWLDAMRTALDAARRGEYFFADTTDDARLRVLLNRKDHLYGFRFEDGVHAIRAFLAAASAAQLLTLDIQQLIEEGCIEDEDELWTPPQPLIVLTEGSSDGRALRDSLKLLYPELANYVSFLDFELAGTDGGASHLVRFARMFIGCGIRNRILILFDNDAAGHEALKDLQRGFMPTTVFAIPLPELAVARAYPTLGPEGAGLSDLNGRACSIEMYFGADCLRGLDGSQLPIRWKDFKKSVDRYQGEIVDKARVAKQFEQKIQTASRDPAEARNLDFSGIRSIFEAIFAAVAGR